MKRILSLGLIISLFLLFLAGGCSWSGYKTAQNILNNQLQITSHEFKLFSWCFNGLPFIDKLPKLLSNQRFIVLLQNNMELRPSGGFMGSYAVVETAPSGIKAINIQDIYVPDGQLLGHVDPPAPIQQAFGQGWWKLRDANWDPDFAIAAEQVAWFFEQGGESANGIIAVNLSLVKSLLHILGPVKLLDFPETISADNLYPITQSYADHNFFPGSTQKKDFLSALGKEVIDEIKSLTLKQGAQFARLVFVQLKSKQILLWFKDPSLQSVAKTRDWTGELDSPSGNFLYIVETNLGANKANCCVTKQVSHEINGRRNQLILKWKNESEFTNPVKPLFWGGDYINFVRVIIPATDSALAVKVGNKVMALADEFKNTYGIESNIYTVEQRKDFNIVSFWTRVEARNSLEVSINYEAPISDIVEVQRQPGVESFNYSLSVDNKNFANKRIVSDETFYVKH